MDRKKGGFRFDSERNSSLCLYGFMNDMHEVHKSETGELHHICEWCPVSDIFHSCF